MMKSKPPIPKDDKTINLPVAAPRMTAMTSHLAMTA